VIVTFGEMVVAITPYMEQGPFFATLVFALVVGLFFIYNFEYDHMVDHEADTDGMAYMALNAVIVIVLSNLTVALEFMPDDTIPHLPKSAYLTACLVLYLLMSIPMARYSKRVYIRSRRYATGRLTACAIVVLAAALTRFDPRITLGVDVAVVLGALADEWRLFYIRTLVINHAIEAGISCDMLVDLGYDTGTREGRAAFERDARLLMSQWEAEDGEDG
jgi:low temperature requirement protein LtrA